MRKIFLSLILLISSLIVVFPANHTQAASSFIMPTEGEVTSGYGYRIHPITGERKLHAGIDIAKPGTVPVVASASGTVSYSGTMSGYGNVVRVKHNINGQSFETLYAHLASRSVSVGDKVTQNQRIGYQGSTGNVTGQHLHFEVHKGAYKNPINPMDALKGEFDYVEPLYEVYHSYHGLMETFTSYTAAKEYSQKWQNTVVIRISDGKQLFANGVESNRYTLWHSQGEALASFSFDFNAISYSEDWQNTIVISNVTGKQIYARSELGATRYEVFHSNNGVLADFHFDFNARAYSNRFQSTIVIEKSTGEQIYKHPDANGLQYEVHHSYHGKLTTFSYLSAATRYSNNWQNTVVIDNVTKKEMYFRSELGDYRYQVKNSSGTVLAEFHFEPNANDFAAKYSPGTVSVVPK